MKRWHIILVGSLMEAAYLSFYVVADSSEKVLLFIGVNVFSFLLLILLWLRARREKIEYRPFGWIIGFAILFRLTLVLHAPVASDDVYRYVWDGKVAVHGINPFRNAPIDTMLAELHTAELPSKINFPAMRTIYPPLAQGLFFVSNLVFGDSVSGLKFLLVLADIATILILYRLFSVQFSNLMLYAWSPLPIMYFGLDGHIDVLGIPFLLLCIYFVERRRSVPASVMIGLAALSKLYPLFIVPLLSSLEGGWRKLTVPLIALLMFAAGCFLYWEETGGLIESFSVFTSTFAFNGSIFHLLYKIVPSNVKAHLISTLLFVVWMVGVFFNGREFREKVFLAFLGFVICAPVLHPWYLSWLAALLVLRWSGAVFVLLVTSNFSNLVVYQYHLTGLWKENPVVVLLEYIPFYAVLLWELSKGKFGAALPISLSEN